MRKTGLQSPLSLIITMMVMIFMAEALVMLIFSVAGYEITISEGLMDATLLSLMIAPGMYVLLFKPMREQQSQILRSKKWLRDITDHLPEALVSIDENGIVKSFNPAAEAMFGLPAKGVIGHSVNMLMSDEEAREHDRHMRHYMKTGKSAVLGHLRELEAKRSNGEIFPIELQVRELKSNQQTYFIGMIRDISDRRSEELRQQRVKERIERAQRLESLGVLAGGIAHDFNNILSSMLGNAELLRIDLGALDEDAENCMQNIETGCNHAADLCRQMLAYAGKGRYVIESVDISELVLGMQKLIHVSVPKSIVVHKELADNPPLIHADIAQMEQVVLNLLTNAAEAIGDEDGEIRLSTGVQTLTEKDMHAFEGAESMQPGDFVYLQVQDSGCGIRPEDMAHLFEPFFTTKFTGRGLGMSAILGILRSHGGGIHIDTVPDEGTTIRVLMPAQAEAVAKPVVQSSAKGQGDWKGSGAVLVVDDEMQLRDMASKMLTRMGFEPHIAEDGSQALNLLAERNGAFSAVLLDLTMPGLSGVDVLNQIRALYPDLKVIISTGYGEQALADHFKTTKPDGFVAKPYRYQQLVEAMLKTLG